MNDQSKAVGNTLRLCVTNAAAVPAHGEATERWTALPDFLARGVQKALNQKYGADKANVRGDVLRLDATTQALSIAASASMSDREWRNAIEREFEAVGKGVDRNAAPRQLLSLSIVDADWKLTFEPNGVKPPLSETRD